ncbi:MAG: hypothetical protein U0175_25560 [Caldilineaceae bacterium]
MSQTQSTPKPSARERLLQLVARYHAANKNGTALSPEDQQELEALVMSELKMPLDRAKNLLVHLVQYSEDDEEEVDDVNELGDEEDE